eukprot:g22643.t1
MGARGRRGDSRRRGSRSRAPRGDTRSERGERSAARSERRDEWSNGYNGRAGEGDQEGYGRRAELPRSKPTQSRSQSQPQSRPIREALPRRRKTEKTEPLATAAVPEKAAQAVPDAPRKSKWDDRGDGTLASTTLAAPPDWVRDLESLPQPSPPAPLGPLVSRDSLRRKTMRLKAVQIRVLLGKGGETIRNICERTNAEIKVDHDRVADEGAFHPFKSEASAS